MLAEDFGIPVFITWLEISSELTGKKLSSSAVDVDGRIGPAECKTGLVWSELVSTCFDTNVENLSVCFVGLPVVASNEGEGDGEVVGCGNNVRENFCCIDWDNCGDVESANIDDGLGELTVVGTVFKDSELVVDGA